MAKVQADIGARLGARAKVGTHSPNDCKRLTAGRQSCLPVPWPELLSDGIGENPSSGEEEFIRNTTGHPAFLTLSGGPCELVSNPQCGT